MIYEGANGVQALDLVGRKLPRDGGRAIFAFFNELAGFAKDHGTEEAMKPYVAPMSTALGHLQQATTWLMQNALAKPDNAGAPTTDYMPAVRPRRLRLYVGADGESRAGQDCQAAARRPI